MCISQHVLSRHFKVFYPLVIYMRKITVQRLCVNIVLRRPLNTINIHLILVRILQQTANLAILCYTSFISPLLYPDISRKILVWFISTIFHIGNNISHPLMHHSFNLNIDYRTYMLVCCITQLT